MVFFCEPGQPHAELVAKNLHLRASCSSFSWPVECKVSMGSGYLAASSVAGLSGEGHHRYYCSVQQAPLHRGANYLSSTSSEGSTPSASASRMIVEKRGSTSSFSILDSAFWEIPASLASCSCVQNLATLLALTPRPIFTPAIVDTLFLVNELYLTSMCQ